MASDTAVWHDKFSKSAVCCSSLRLNCPMMMNSFTVIFVVVLHHAQNDAIYSDILENIGKVENKQTGERLSLGDFMTSLASGQTR